MKRILVALALVLLAFGPAALGAETAREAAVPLLTGGCRWRKQYTFFPPQISRQSLVAHGLDADSEAQRRNLGINQKTRLCLAFQ